MIFAILLILALFAVLICLSDGFDNVNGYEEYLKLEYPDMYREIHEQKLHETERKAQSDELRRRL